MEKRMAAANIVKSWAVTMAGADKRSGDTHAVEGGLGGRPRPKLPHERDESSDSQTEGVRPVIRQAHDDLASGIVDTDKGKPLGEAYRHQKTDKPGER